MRFTIAHKLVAMIVFTIVVAATSIFFAAYYSIDKSFNQFSVENITADSKVLNFRLDKLREQYLGTAVNNAVRPNVIKGVLEKNTAFLQKLGKDMIASKAADFVTVTDDKGLVLARGHDPKVGDSIADQKGFQGAAAGKSVVTLESSAVVAVSLLVSAPVTDQGKVIGVIIMGMDLSKDHHFVEEMKSILGVDITIFIGDTRMTTTLVKDGKRAVGTKMDNPKVLETVLRRGEQFIAPNIILGKEYMTGYSPLKDSAGAIVGMLFVGKDLVDIKASKQQVVFSIVVSSLVVIVIMVLGGLVWARTFSRPIVQSAEFARMVAAGQFDHELNVHKHDEIGVLADALRAMLKNLKEKIGEAESNTCKAQEESLKAQQATIEATQAKEQAERARFEGMQQAASKLDVSVVEINDASKVLSGKIEHSRKGAVVQSQRVAETATAMEEMNATVLEVAKSASKASETTESAKKKAQEGEKVVGLVVKGIDDVQSQAMELKDDMSTLGQQAEGIGRIMGVISDIADQTNLLALNAAIEAARAGEAGRGFTVVADEVRKLAEKTMTATKEVGDAIRGIQQGTRKNMDNVDKTVQTIRSATDLAKKSGDALNEIVSLVDLAADQVRSIATASEEQSATSEEISRSVEDINRISNETSDAMQQATQAVSEVSSQAHVLQGLIREMQRK